MDADSIRNIIREELKRHDREQKRSAQKKQEQERQNQQRGNDNQSDATDEELDVSEVDDDLEPKEKTKEETLGDSQPTEELVDTQQDVAEVDGDLKTDPEPKEDTAGEPQQPVTDTQQDVFEVDNDLKMLPDDEGGGQKSTELFSDPVEIIQDVQDDQRSEVEQPKVTQDAQQRVVSSIPNGRLIKTDNQEKNKEQPDFSKMVADQLEPMIKEMFNTEDVVRQIESSFGEMSRSFQNQIDEALSEQAVLLELGRNIG